MRRRQYYGNLIHERFVMWLKTQEQDADGTGGAPPGATSTDDDESYTSVTESENEEPDPNPNIGTSITITVTGPTEDAVENEISQVQTVEASIDSTPLPRRPQTK